MANNYSIRSPRCATHYVLAKIPTGWSVDCLPGRHIINSSQIYCTLVIHLSSIKTQPHSIVAAVSNNACLRDFLNMQLFRILGVPWQYLTSAVIAEKMYIFQLRRGMPRVKADNICSGPWVILTESVIRLAFTGRNVVFVYRLA